MKAAGKSVKALDTIPYVVCLDGTSNGATNRAYHPDDVRKGVKELEIDIDYYIKNQVSISVPVIQVLDPEADDFTFTRARALSLTSETCL
jgi:DNA polymerase elongation subunit (family B)